MRALLLSTAGLLLVATAGADEPPPLPKSLRRPDVALARAQVEGKKVAVVVKVVQTKAEVFMAKQTVYESVEKVVNGQKVKEQVPVERMMTFQRETPVGYREVKLFGADVTARDAAGKAVPERKLVELLATEAPVLLAPSADPIDPFYLLTTKAGTLILHVDPAKLVPPKDAAPGPR